MIDTNNKVELQGFYGGDIEHALSAWTSTSRELDDEKRARIPQLLKKLAEGSDGNPHGTPFEKSAIHFLVNAETASHIHMLKHRIGVSINGASARYRELKGDSFYLPTDWPSIEREALRIHCLQCFERYHQVLESLVTNYGIDRGRAKESARFYLPYASKLTFDILFNFRSFVHFVKLRRSRGAQKEIYDIADEMVKLVKETGAFKYSLEAWEID